MHRFLTFLIGLLILCLAACNSTRMVGTWKNDDYFQPSIDTVAVIGIVKRLDIRRALEQETAEELRDRGYHVVEGLEVLSLDYQPTEDNRSNLRDKMGRHGVDAVVTLSLLDVKEEERYVPGTVGYQPQTYYNPFFNYFTTVHNRVYQPGYYRNSVEVFMESNLFDLHANEVMWSGQSRTYQRRSVKNFADDFANVVVESMDQSEII